MKIILRSAFKIEDTECSPRLEIRVPPFCMQHATHILFPVVHSATLRCGDV